jgi:hypothetical protein
VHQRKDRRRRSDPQCQRDHRRAREPRRLPQLPHRLSQTQHLLAPSPVCQRDTNQTVEKLAKFR